MVLLIAVTTLGTLPLHLLVPALPSIASSLQSTPEIAQLTIGCYLAGIAIGQLLYGPISDRIGRRPALLFALVLFTLASAAATIASTMTQLIVVRVFQALGACGTLVLGRAMIRDVSTGRDSVARLALLTMTVSLTPAIAPLVGGHVVTGFGWRAVFSGLSIVGALFFLWSALRLPETLLQRNSTLDLKGAFNSYRILLSNPSFRSFAAAGAFGTVSLYAFLSVSPFIFITVLGKTADEAGILYMVIIAGITAGALVARWSIGVLSPRRGAQLGISISLIGASAMLVMHHLQAISLHTIVFTMVLFAFGAGMTSPNATSGAISSKPTIVGAASGLFGFCQQAFGALITMLAALWHDGSIQPVAILMVMSTVLGLLALSRDSASASIATA
jgi:DHA1 family bicyclomycin/chloramphenicol resistance-like MFS transporter